MDDTTRKLLDDHSTFILPEEIEHEAYTFLLEAVLHMTGKPLTLYCRGNGGSSRSALAMVDLITAHGNVIGMLAGEACSSHGIIWAACQQRYVYPYGVLAVHMTARDGISTRIDMQVLKQMTVNSEKMNRQNAAILGAACKTATWWYGVITDAGSAETIDFDAAQLIEMGMARPITDYRPTEYTNGLVKAGV